jgi:DNA-binding Lrp family transcriptional regulator
MTAVVDRLDASLLRLLAAQPRLSVVEAARQLGVARGTVQARLERLQRNGVIRGFGPVVEPAAVGFPVTAFMTLEIRQGGGYAELVQHLASIPEVLEATTTSGQGDLLVRVVARSNADLQRVIDDVVADPVVSRSSTVIALAHVLPLRTMPLVEAAVAHSANVLDEPDPDVVAG